MLARAGAPSTASLVFLSLVLALLLFSVFLSSHGQVWCHHGSSQRSRTCSFVVSSPSLWDAAIALLWRSDPAARSPMIVGSGIAQLRRRLLASPLYDQQAVARKTARWPIGGRLRLYVFGPGRDCSLCHTFAAIQCSVSGKPLDGSEMSSGSTPRDLASDRCARSFARVAHRMARMAKEENEEEAAQGGLSRLIAAYRQFDTASANYFVAKHQTDRMARSLVQGKWWRDVASSCHYLTSDVVSRAWYLPQASMFDLPGIEQNAPGHCCCRWHCSHLLVSRLLVTRSMLVIACRLPFHQRF